jgi:hypothetical protein
MSTYTVEIQAGGDDIWQALAPAETVDTREWGGDWTAEDVARTTADHQTLAEGTDWRVCVWIGADADIGMQPDAVAYPPENSDEEDQPAYRISRDGLAPLALPVELEAQLRDAWSADFTIGDAVEAAVNAKIDEHGTSADGVEWLGPWSPADVVADVLNGHIHGFTAMIGAAPDVVAGDYYDVSVTANEVPGVTWDGQGNEVPEAIMGAGVVMDAVELPLDIHLGDASDACDLAEGALEERGWRRIGPWEWADTAAYASVERV